MANEGFVADCDTWTWQKHSLGPREFRK